MELPVYLDHAATTPVDPSVLEAMLPYFTEHFGNPATLYSVGQAARAGADGARAIIADTLNASPEEIIFTSGGTEADNAAILGIAEANPHRGKHLLTTPIEHHAVLAPMEALERDGYELEFIPVDGDGRVDLGEFVRRIREDTLLVSVMGANNEVGTVQPIEEIGAICRDQNVFFHTDAVQAYSKVPIDVHKMKIDLLSLAGHKIYGPKGIGALYVRRGIALAPFQMGGGQERGRRGGTLNVPGIVGLGEAARLAHEHLASETARLLALRDSFMDRLAAAVPDITITGSRIHRLATHIHICVRGVEGEPMLLGLDAAGICASAGSACSSGATEPSHVLKALGVPRDRARGALRLTMGHSTTAEAMDYTLDTLIKLINRLRSLADPTGSIAVSAS